MNNKLKRLSKSTISVLLSLLMVISTVTVGIIATSAAYDNSEKVGWTTSNSFVRIKIGTGNWQDLYIDSNGKIEFEFSVDCAVQWKFKAEDTWYGHYSSDTQPDGSSSSDWYEARSSAWSGNDDFYVSNMKAGKYVIEYKDRRNDNNTFWYTFYRKQAIYHGGTGSGSWSESEMRYTGDNCYKYTINGDGNQKRFRTNWVDGSTTTIQHPSQTSYNIKNNTTYNGGYTVATGSSDNYFYFDTVSGGTYTVCLKYDKVWLEYTEPSVAHTITLSDGGTVGTEKSQAATVSPDSATFGTSVTITAYPKTGYQANVSTTAGTLSGNSIRTSGGTVTLTMPDSDCTVTVSYAEASDDWKPDLTGYKKDDSDVNFRLFTSIGDKTFKNNAHTYSEIMHKGSSYWIEFNSTQIDAINDATSDWTKFYCALSNSSSYGNIATSSATVNTDNCDVDNYVNKGGSKQAADHLDTGTERKFALLEFKQSRLNTLTGCGVLIDASNWNSPKYYFYTNTAATAVQFDGYYLTGRMTVAGNADGTGAAIHVGGDAATDFDALSTKAKFKDEGNGIYSYNTGKTISQLATPEGVGTADVRPHYFLIYDKNRLWGDIGNTNSDFYYNNSALLAHSTTKMSNSVITQQKRTECELLFDEVHTDEDSDGKVKIWIDASGVTDKTAGSGTMKIYYTLEDETTPLAKSVTLTASPKSQVNTGDITLTATLQNINTYVDGQDCTYKFYDGETEIGSYTNKTGKATHTVRGGTNGDHNYKVVVTTDQTYGSGNTKYRKVSAKTIGTFRDPSVFITNDITSSTAAVAWEDTRNVNEYTIQPQMSAGQTYTFSLSDVSEFNPYFTKYEIDESLSKFMDISYGQKTVTVDGEPVSVRTYVFTTRNYCTDPTITVDNAHHKVYAVATFNKYGGNSKTLSNTTEKVKYYFAKKASQDKDGVNYIDGTKGMYIKYYNNSVISKAETKWAVPVKADGTTSNGAYSASSVQCVKGNTDEAKYQIKVDESQLFRNTTGTAKKSSLTYDTYDVYVLEMPIWATSANICNSSGTTQLGSPILSLNPNRIYVFWSGENDNNNDDKQWSGVPLDKSFWLSQQSISGVAHRGETNYQNNQVPLKNFKTNLINYKTGTNDQWFGGTINATLSEEYDTRDISRPLYWGLFTGGGAGNPNETQNDLYQWDIALNLAQRAGGDNGQSFYASIWNIVNPELTPNSADNNPLGGGLLTAYDPNNQLMPFFDYNYLKTTNGQNVGTAYTDKDFPFYSSTYDNVTTYSYDSMVDLNRQYNTSGTNSGKYTLTNPVKLGNNLGYAPISGEVAGFANEYDVNFYMTNTGKIQGDKEEHDISFNFSGDDDVWVFVDGVLVLDLGGDHKISAGSINFSDMKVYYKTAAKDFTSGMGVRPSPDWAVSSDSIYTMDLDALFKAYGVKFNKTDATTKHTLQMFYMERGRNESNLSLSFNLPQASGLSVKNNVTANYVNPGLLSAALGSASSDYFNYTIENALAPSDKIAAWKAADASPYKNVRDAVSTVSGLSFLKPLYPANTNAVRSVSGIDYQLAKETGNPGTAADGYTPPDLTTFVPVTNVNYLLSDENLTTEATDLTGHINNTGDDANQLHLLSGQMANFIDSVGANTLVRVKQIPNMGTTNTNADGLTEYEKVNKNDTGNYYITSYKITEDNINADLQSQTGYTMLEGNDSLSAYDIAKKDDFGDSFYFSSYSSDEDKSNPAMTVEFFNEIAVGEIRVEKKYDKAYSTQGTKFRFTIQFANVFGDDEHYGTLAEYNGLEYLLYNSADDTLVTEAPQVYNSEVGIVLEAGQYAKILGVPVETRYKVTERNAANHSLVSIEKTARKNNGNLLNDTNTFHIDSRTFYDETLKSSSTDVVTTPDVEEYNSATSFRARSTSDGFHVVADDDMTYYVNMIPAVEESIIDNSNREFESLEAAENSYESVNKIVFTNKKEAFSITFKYFDRLEQNDTASQIKSTPTEYSFNLESLDPYAEYFSQETTVGGKTYQSGDFKKFNFEQLIKDKAVEFATDSNISNIIDSYHMWTTQSAAVTAMKKKTNVKTGVTYSGDNLMYHTDYIGQPLSAAAASNERWVTFKAQNGTTLADPMGFSDCGQNETAYANGDISAYDRVKSIVVWCFNEPKQYTVTVHHSANNDDLTPTKVSLHGVEHTFYKSNNAATTAITAYYNQRLGKPREGAFDEAGFFEQYGMSGYTNQVPESCIAGQIGSNYKFAYWAFDPDGKQVASTDYKYYYRITNSIQLYPIYTTINNPVEVPYGLSVVQNDSDTYVDNNGKSKTRLNVMFNPYGLTDNDPNILNSVVLNIVFQDNQLASLNCRGDNNTGLIELFEANRTGLETYLNKNAKATMTDSVSLNSDNNSDNYVNRGFMYTMKGNAGDTGSPTNVVVQLTNKNRMQFTSIFNTATLYKEGQETKILQVTAMKYNDNGISKWIISDNCIVNRFQG